MLTDEQRQRLAWEARASVTKAFLASPGGTAYGAAVITASGNRFQAGQYSSFNHVTNIHAEQAALLLATMADDPDVLALAVASTGGQPVTSPCGVCRQVLAEHSARTGRDFEVLMARRGGDGFESARVSSLLPMAWHPGGNRASRGGDEIRHSAGPSVKSPGGSVPATGDHVRLTDGSIAMVWDGRFEPGRLLAKVKYVPAPGGFRKVAHSFTDSRQYQADLRDMGWSLTAASGIRGAIVGMANIDAVHESPPLHAMRDAPSGPLVGILRDNGVNLEGVRVTGSRAIGISRKESDWDLVVPVDPERLGSVRRALAESVARGELGLPPRSGTWEFLGRVFPGGRDAILQERRFADTVFTGGSSVALIFVPDQPGGFCVETGSDPRGRGSVHGKVIDARQAAFKRGEYLLEDLDGPVRLACYHKSAGLMRAGDVVSASGWMFHGKSGRRVVQIMPCPDAVTWWEPVKEGGK